MLNLVRGVHGFFHARQYALGRVSVRSSEIEF